MSLDLKIIKNYSQSLYASSSKEKIQKKLLEQLAILVQVFNHSRIVKEMFYSPVIDGQKKRDLIDLLVKKYKFHKYTQNFLYILVKNARFNLLKGIVDNFTKIIAESENIKYVQVRSAHKLEQKSIELISTFLEKELGKKIDLKTSLDQSLIGGAVIKYDCNIIDCSVSGAIDKVKKITQNPRIRLS